MFSIQPRPTRPQKRGGHYTPYRLGGADASQNGLGDLIPAKDVFKLAIYVSPAHASFCRAMLIASAASRPSLTAATVRSSPAVQSPPA